MSDNAITDDPTATALDNAANWAESAPDMIAEGGTDGPSGGGASEGASHSVEGGAASGPSGGTGGAKGSDASMAGDAVMSALTNASAKGKAMGGLGTLGRKVGAHGAMKSAGAVAGLGLDVKTVGLAGIIQTLGAVAEGMTDKYRVQQSGEVTPIADMAKAQSKRKPTMGRILQNGKALTEAERTSASKISSYDRKKPNANNALARKDPRNAGQVRRVTGASLQPGSRSEFIINQRKKDTQARIQNIQEVGHRGVQKNAAYDAKSQQGPQAPAMPVALLYPSRKRRVDNAFNM